MKSNRVGRLLVIVAVVSWMLAGRAEAQALPLNPDPALAVEALDQSLPPLPKVPIPVPPLPDPVSPLPDPVPPLIDKVPLPPVDKLPPLPLDPQKPSPVADVVNEVQPQVSPVTDDTESSTEKVTPAPAHKQPSGRPSGVKSGGKARPVALGASAEAAAAPDDLEEVTTSGQQITPGQVLSETVSVGQGQGADQGPGLSRTGFVLFDWIAAAGFLIVAGWLSVWASRHAPSFSPLRA